MVDLEDIQDEIVERLHAGEDVDRDALLAENPEHGEALKGFFALLDVIEEAPPGDAPAPTRLGEFRVERELGRGGMGVVYVAEQVSLKRRVALKVLPPALRADPRLLARFQREAEAAGRLRHPGIVPVFSVGEAAGTPFFAMELVEGRSLDGVIRELRAGGDAGLPPAGEERVRWAVETVAKVADALAYAHGRGILHRDVKPGNIILEADGTPRLTDFGLALDLRAPGLTVAGEVFGSPQYMSPEQALRREAPVDERTDVYSLAVTLYELLTLRLPYRAETRAELLTALAAGKVVPAEKADPTVPKSVAAVLSRALQKEPGDRYAGAADFAADLRAAISPEGKTVAAARCRKRRRLPAVLAGVAALVVLAVGAVGLFGNRARPLALEGAYIPSRSLRALARGELPNGAEVLGGCMRPGIYVRRVLSRGDLGPYQCVVEFGIADTGWEPVSFLVVAYWEASVNGAPFMPIGSGYAGMKRGASSAPEGLVTNKFTLAASPLLATVLGDAAKESSVSVRHRVTVRIAERPEGWVDPEKTPLTGGTAWTWTGPGRDLLIYDEYPEDYPEAVSDPETDRRMREALTPEHAFYTGVKVVEKRRILEMSLHYSGERNPLPAACEVEVRLPDGGRLVGTAELSFDAAPPPEGEETVTTTQLVGMAVRLPEGGGKEEAETLLGLETGRIDRIALIFRPSRRVALGKARFDRYWGGTLEVEVPLKKGHAGIGDLLK